MSDVRKCGDLLVEGLEALRVASSRIDCAISYHPGRYDKSDDDAADQTKIKNLKRIDEEIRKLMRDLASAISEVK